MKLKIKLILIPFLFSTLILHGQDDVEFKVGVPIKVQVGDEFFLSYKANRKAKEINVEGDFLDFRINYGPSVSTSNSTSITNGIMTKTEQTTFSYSLVALKTGNFKLPRASVVIDSVRYFSDSISISVVEKDTSSIKSMGNSSKNIFAKLILSNDTVFKQESIVAKLILYSDASVSSIDNFQIPQNENFLFYDINIPEKLEMKPDTFDNKILKSVLLKEFLLIPTKTGEFSLDKIKIDCRVKKLEPKKSNAFDDFFKSYQTETISIYSDSTKIFVQDYDVNIPSDFSYVSGKDLKIAVSIDKKIITKNESFKYTLSISGFGNLKLLSIPRIDFPQSLELIDCQVYNDIITDNKGIHGERVFSYYLYSNSIGRVEIPSLSISYYDLENSKCQLVSSPTIILEISDNDSIHNESLLKPDKSLELQVKRRKSKCATMIVMDLSASMLAQDLQPNRKSALIKTISEYASETNQNIGIIAYSLIPHLLVPVSMKKTSIVNSLKTIDSLKLGEGTSTGMAICMALDVLNKAKAKYKSIILLTDGESNKGAINDEMAIEFAMYFKVPINIIGISADKEFVPITIDPDIFSRKQTTTIPVLIDDDKLKKLSEQTGGNYYRAVDNETLELAVKEIDKNKKIKVGNNELDSIDYSEYEIQKLINLVTV